MALSPHKPVSGVPHRVFLRMPSQYWREGLLAALTLAGIVATLWYAPIPQDQAYHVFADRRTFWGIPNFWNVASNLAFVLVGGCALHHLSRRHPSSSRSAYLVSCLGVMGVGVGSAYYHLAPSIPTLVWDRIPMTVVCMALFAMVVRDRLGAPLDDRMLWPAVLAGVASVGYWYWSELHGRGDLRAYGLIQFLPMLLLPLLLLLYPGKGLRTAWLWGTLATYTLAKVAEHFDQGIYDRTGLVSGHSIKHVCSALALLWAVFAVTRLPHDPS